MPRLNPFDKKTATTYALVNRPQDDPLTHDSDAPSQIFTEIGSSRQEQASKVKHRGDLEEEFGIAVRQNEGEAAEHGVFFDDSNYDYMQHMRDLNSGGGEATWVEAKTHQKGKGKEKQSLEDALRESSLEDDANSVGGISFGGSSRSQLPVRSAYEQQQDLPEELAGFHPDMDPRLREVLDALDDDAYVDDQDDIFGELAGEGGEEVDRDVWEDSLYDQEDEEGWESDETEKPAKEYGTTSTQPSQTPSQDDPPQDKAPPDLDEHLRDPSIPAPSAESQDLLASLAASKRGTDNKPTLQKPTTKPKASDLTSSAQFSTSSSALPGRRKKRKGAMTSSSGFSMTSSALARTEPLSMLDSRFDKIVEGYLEDCQEADDEDGEGMSIASGMTGGSHMSKASGFSTASKCSAWGGSQAPSEAPSLVSESQFDSVLDDFLGGAEGKTKARLMRKGGTQGRYFEGQGMKQLDELREGLGAARVSGRYVQKT